MLGIQQYTIRSRRVPPGFDGCVIVQLTDLHGRSFGRGNGELIRAVRSLGPVMIVMTGDMVNYTGDGGAALFETVRVLGREYPIFFVDGNHELAIRRKRPGDGARIDAELAAAGVDRLANVCRFFFRGGDRIAVAGLQLPKEFYLPFFDRRSRRTLTGTEIGRRLGPAPDLFTLLLVHTPFFFEAYARWGADLTLAGHLHGGMIRLPLVGGLLSPDWTLFPRYAAGRFVRPRRGGGESSMIVGRGLGSSRKLRIFNPPEVVAVTLRRS